MTTEENSATPSSRKRTAPNSRSDGNDSTSGGGLRLEWNVAEGMWRIVRFGGDLYSPMGEITSGTHRLYPEEGVWLAETGAAELSRDGKTISLQQGYQLLAKSNVPWSVYLTYCAIRSIGFVAIRSMAKRNTLYLRGGPDKKSQTKASSSSSSSPQSSAHRPFSSALMEAFPSVSSGTSLQIRSSLLADSKLVPEKLPATRDIRPHSYAFTPAWCTTRGLDRSFHPGRQDGPWLSNLAKKASNWAEFSVARKELENDIRRPTSSRQSNHDFDVFEPGRKKRFEPWRGQVQALPLLRITIMMPDENLHRLVARTNFQVSPVENVRSLAASVDPAGRVLFLDIRYGRPVTLKSNGTVE